MPRCNGKTAKQWRDRQAMPSPSRAHRIRSDSFPPAPLPALRLPGLFFAALLLLSSREALLYAQQSPPAPMAAQQGGASTAGAYAPIHEPHNRAITARVFRDHSPVVIEDIFRLSR